jgi:hypothetical protein
MATDWTALKVEYINGSMQYYVYDLIDPRTGKTFYVGKGAGGRVKQHLRDSLAGRYSNHEKHKAIMEIVDSGKSPIEAIIARFDNEDDALKFEKCRIAELGIENLTNIKTKGNRSVDVLREVIETAERISKSALNDVKFSANMQIVEFQREFIEIAKLLTEKANFLRVKNGINT